MSIYHYICEVCGYAFVAHHHGVEVHDDECPECGAYNMDPEEIE
jgi:putative FmdB family regulatory protein